MRQLMIVLFVVVTFIFPAHIHADEKPSIHKWQKLNQTSDRILQLVKGEEYEEARQLLTHFSTLFLEMNFQAEGVEMHALRMVTLTYEKAEEAVTAVNLSAEERIHLVTAFRLAVDALSSDHHPLWLYSEDAIMEAIQELAESLKVNDHQAYQHRLNKFFKQYELIRPALIISLNESSFQKLQSQVVFLDKQRNNVERKLLERHLEMLKNEFEEIYKKTKESGADPSLWWIILIIGSVITITLTYVSWKKYKAEKKRVRMKE